MVILVYGIYERGRDSIPYPTLWTNLYFMSTIGGAPLEIVKQYIGFQKTSQRKQKGVIRIWRKHISLEYTQINNRKF